jgi:hypothetical protein
MAIHLAAPRLWLAGAAALVIAGLGVASFADAAIPKDCNRCFAMVRRDGTLVNHRGVTISRRLTTPGQYIIEFKYPTNRCAVNATIDSLEDSLINTSANIVVSRNAETPLLVGTVITYPGSEIDQPFSLVVTC